MNELETNSQYLADFAKLNVNQKKFIKKYKFNSLVEILKQFPDEKKFIKLINSIVSENKLLNFSSDLVNASFLIKNGLNKDVVYNYLTQLKTETLNVNRILDKKTFLLLKERYTEQKVCELVLLADLDKYITKEIHKGLLELSEMIMAILVQEDLTPDEMKLKVKEYIKKSLIKQPKTLLELHDAVFKYVAYEKNKQSIKDYSLNQREDFLKMSGQEIKVAGESFIIDVPKTRLDLASYSRHDVFNNCIGKSETYAKQCAEGRASIIGIFDKNKKPKYCILTGKYSFKQARGVSNGEIPKEIYQALEDQLTLTPTIPNDFIPVEHSFIFGYKYNPEKKSLYLMFKPKGNNEGNIYEYLNVENEVYEEFSKIDRKGSYLNSTIKKYSCEKLTA